MITPINQGGSPLDFFHEVTEEMRFIGIVETLDTPFGHNAATVRLGEFFNVSEGSS